MRCCFRNTRLIHRSLFSRCPFLRLAGIRIDPELNSRQRLTQFTGLSVKWFDSGKLVRIELPASARIGAAQWSNDGKKIVFTCDVESGVELWVANAATGKAAPIAGIRVNDVLGMPFEWTKDNKTLMVKLVPPGQRKTPEQPKVPLGPIVEETAGKVSRVPTYEDLLKDPFDEQLFEFFGTSQLALVNSETGTLKPVASPTIVISAWFSPDERYMLVTTLKKPFCTEFPISTFRGKLKCGIPRGVLSLL